MTINLCREKTLIVSAKKILNRKMADKRNNNKDPEKLRKEVQEAWSEFTKDSKKAQEEIKEAFDKKNSEWSVGRVSTVIVVSGVILAIAVGLLRYLLI